MFKDRIFASKNQYILPVTALVSIIIYLISSFYIRFQVTLNDFWGVLYYAKHLSIFEPASLYNGFFPIGYPFLLSFLPYAYVIYFAFAINIVSAGLFTGLISSLFFSIKKSGLGVLLVFLITLSYPLIFRYASTTSADMATAAFSIGGVYFLWRSEFQNRIHDHQTRDDILAGLLFGFSAIFRSHGIISAAAILLAYTLMTGIRRLWMRKTILITLAFVYFIQIGANLLSGHGALETGQNFNAYITFYGINWSNIPSEVYSFSVITQFFKDPTGFVRLYIPLFLHLIVYGLPACLCLFFLRDGPERKYAGFVFLATLIYAIPLAIGTTATDRGPFPVLGMAITCAGLLSMELWSRGQILVGSSKVSRGLTILILASAVLWIATGWISDDWSFLSLSRAQAEDFRKIETNLIENGMKEPSEVFTNNADLYFPDLPPFRPYINGGWENYSLWNYRQQYPEIPTDSWESFISACSAHNIKFIVLTPGAGSVASFTGKLYNDKFHPVEVELMTTLGNTKIFKIKN